MMPVVTDRLASDSTPAPAVLAAFAIDPTTLQKAATGLINQTWSARNAEGVPCVLQRVNSVFPAEIHHDIEAVTRHLHAKGLTTPVLIPTRSGTLWHEHDGAVWRAMTRIEGTSYEALRNVEQAREAGRILGVFHRALVDLAHRFRHARLGVHDTARHLATLRATLEEHRGHSAFANVSALGAEVLELAAEIDQPPYTPDRIVHGDPKISNVMFAHDGRHALCLIDLDTVARMPVALELGDAFRSWCNPKTEDTANATFDVTLFGAAIGGYAAGSEGLLEPAEWDAIPGAIFRITVELAARFCADALRERYFGWDKRRFASASEHNQARTRGQLDLARTVRSQLPAIEDLVTRAARL
jgi:Ser/Thr protein kinase RdoA (MazF antagonist)